MTKLWHSLPLYVGLIALLGFILPVLADAGPGTTEAEDRPLSELPLSEKLFTLGRSAVTGKLPQAMIDKQNREDQTLGLVQLTDDNYEELVTHGDPNILWVILISDLKSENGIGSADFVTAFKNATQLYKEDYALSGLGVEKTGRRVVWAKMDYLTNWITCTRLNVFKPPKVGFMSDAGKVHRFISPRTTNAKGEMWVKWIMDGDWQDIPVWESKFAPGGKYRWMIEYYILFFSFISPFTSKIPTMAWVFIPGLFSQFIIGWLHSRRAPPPAPAGEGGAPAPAPKKPLGSAVERVRNARLAQAQKESAAAAKAKKSQ